MNAIREDAFLFDSGDARLVGIVAAPERSDDLAAARLGVLIVVGGPQYRVGSHRQFVLLSRALAARGFTVMRFDCAGMGDSDGVARAFTERDDEIRAAIDAFVARVPSVTDIAIWGLCDAASAALLYVPTDARVRHLVLLNPWVRSPASIARTQLKHYYSSRLVDRRFWRDVFGGKVHVLRAVVDFGKTLVTVGVARGPRPTDEPIADFQTRMARGWKRFTGDVLLICSGEDITAREFIDQATRGGEWAGLLEERRVTRCDLADADHTFSRAVWRDRVADETATWLARRDGHAPNDRRRGDATQRPVGAASLAA